MVQPGVQLASFDGQNPINQPQQDQIIVPVSPSRPLQPNLPVPELLDSGRRKNYLEFGVPLYQASLKGDWKSAERILARKPELVRFSITEKHETALMVAASAKCTKRMLVFTGNLVNMMSEADLELQDCNSNTALCIAAASGNVEMVKMIMKKNLFLMIIPGKEEMMPLFMATLFGNHDGVGYLYDKSKYLVDDGWKSLLLLKCVEADLFCIALRIVNDYPELASNGSVLGVLARKPDSFCRRRSNICMRTIISMFAVVGIKVGDSGRDSEALQLLRIIWESIAILSKEEIDDILRGPPDSIKQDDKPDPGMENKTLHFQELISENIVETSIKIQDVISESATTSGNLDIQSLGNEKKTYSSRVIFVAAEMGNTKFVVELIRQYPDLIWKVNDNNESIFHIAIKHRREGIYSLLYEIGSRKDLVTPLKDSNDNNMLHLVGKSAQRKRLQEVSGVALQMQLELLWFKEVEAMVPPSYRQEKNKDGLTPHELFSEEHKDLISQGEKWMKGTASQSMVVAALVATIVFAAAFTVVTN